MEANRREAPFSTLVVADFPVAVTTANLAAVADAGGAWEAFRITTLAGRGKP